MQQSMVRKWSGVLSLLLVWSSLANAVVDYRKLNVTDLTGKNLQVDTTLGLASSTNSTLTGAGQDLTTTTPVTVLTNASLTSLRGIVQNNATSQVIWVKNGKASGAITLLNNTGGLIPTQRILTGTGADLDIEPGVTISLVFEKANNRWQVVGGVGSGSNSAGTNDKREYISNGKAETNTTGWSVYADAAGTSPVDGTGGTANVVFSRTTTSGEVLRETASFKLAKDAANRQGQGFSYDFTIDPQDYKNSRAVFVTFDYQTTTNYANDYAAVFVYDKDAGTMQTCRGFTGETSAPFAPIKKADTGGKFACVFYPTSTTSDDYRLIVHTSTTTTTAWDLISDSIHAGPDVLAPTPFITAWQSYTPTFTGVGTTTSVAFEWRRVGTNVEIRGVWVNGTVNGSTLSITLPPGQVSAVAATDTPVGYGYRATNTSNQVKMISVLASPSGTVMNLSLVDTAAAISPTTAQVGTGVMVSSAGYYLERVSIPIVGWAATNMLSTTEVNLQVATAKATLSATSGAITNNTDTKLPINSAISDRAGMLDTSNNRLTARTDADYALTVTVNWSTATGAKLLSYKVNGGSFVYIGYLPSGDRHNASALIPNLKPTDYVEVYVRQASGADATIAAGEANTAVSFYPATTKFSVFGVYGATELLESHVAGPTNWPFAASAWGDLTSLALTPGEWDLSFALSSYANGAVTAGLVQIGISTTSGNSSTGLTFGKNAIFTNQPSSSGLGSALSIPRYNVTVTTPTTYYFKGLYGSAVTNVQHYGAYATARRIK